MSGGTHRHNRIAARVFRAIEDHLKGKPCKVYISDVLVKVRVNRDDHGYYPDVMAVCDRESREGRDDSEDDDVCEDHDERFVCNPKLIVEILSPSTARIERGEKRYEYRYIEALEEYVLVAQDAPEVTVFRRDEAWQPTIHDSPQSALELRSIGLSLPVPALYEGA